VQAGMLTSYSRRPNWLALYRTAQRKSLGAEIKPESTTWWPGFGVASTTSEGKDDKSNAFPWRERPLFVDPQQSQPPWDLEVLRTKFREVINESLVKESLSWSKTDGHVTRSDTDKEREFLIGAVQAFKASTMAIFSSSLAKAAEPNSSPVTATTSQAENETFDVSSVFDPRLARFYSEALASSAKAGHRLHYKLLSLDAPMVTKFEAIYNAKRYCTNSSNKVAIVERSEIFFGLFSVLKVRPKLFQEAIDTDIADLSKLVKTIHDLKKMNYHATLRIWVDFPCVERFYVTDSQSGLVVPGYSNLPTERTHQLLLETTFSLATLDYDAWTVVDLDGWIEANEFWVNSKTQQKQ